MPKKPVDYNKCMFYRLVCRDPTIKEVYVGHTTSEVDRRATHKTCCTNEKSKSYNLFVYRFIREHGSWENWQLIVHEKKPVKDIFEAVLQERKWVEFYMATLNSNVPSRTDAQYNADHRVERAQYYADHREERAQYRADHLEESAQYHAKYRADHADQINEKHKCECGGKHSTSGKSRHYKTARHVAYQATL